MFTRPKTKRTGRSCFHTSAAAQLTRKRRSHTSCWESSSEWVIMLLLLPGRNCWSEKWTKSGNVKTTSSSCANCSCLRLCEQSISVLFPPDSFNSHCSYICLWCMFSKSNVYLFHITSIGAVGLVAQSFQCSTLWRPSESGKLKCNHGTFVFSSPNNLQLLYNKMLFSWLYFGKYAY